MKLAAILGLLLLASCATVDPAVQDAEDRTTCELWGAPAGSAQYPECRIALAQQRTERSRENNLRIQEALRRMGNASAATGAPRSSLSQSPSMGTLCFSRGEALSGMNKICYYDCLGSAAAVTQSAVSLCPLSIRQ